MEVIGFVKNTGICVIDCMLPLWDLYSRILQRCCASQTEPAYNVLQPKHTLTDFGLQPYAAVMCRLMVSTPVIRVG